MRLGVFCFCLSLLYGCSALLPEDGGQNEGFYTWVDERGQMHTRKKPDTNKSTAKSDEQVSGLDDTKGTPKAAATSGNSDFNPQDFTPSTEVEKKLAGAGLLAWQDAGYSHNATYQPSENTPEDPALSSLPSASTKKDALVFREGLNVRFDEIESRSFSLERYYHYSDAAGTDYILLDFKGVDLTGGLVLKSFIKQGKAAMPNVAFLNADYIYLTRPAIPFRDYSPESWSRYGYFYGIVQIPSDSRFLLITPTDQAGVIEVGDQTFGMKDLGELELERLVN